MKHLLFNPMLLALVASTAASQGRPTAEREVPLLTIENALERALKDNLGLLRARAELPAAEAQKDSALAVVFPRLTLGVNTVRNSDEVSFGSPEDRRTILPRNDWNMRLTVQQPIFAGWRERKAYQQTKLGLDQAQAGIRASEDGVLLEVATVYLAAVQADALVDVERKNLALTERRRQQASDLFDAGEVSRVDVLRADTAIKAAEREVVVARRTKEVALGSLRMALAMDDDVTVKEPEKSVVASTDDGELFRQAETARPEIRRAELDVQIAHLEVDKQRGAYLPVVTADAGFVKQKTTFPKDQYGFAALRFTIPIFQGGEIGGRVAFAREREKQAALVLEETKRRVREDVRLAIIDLEAAATNLALAEEQLNAAQAEYEQTFDLYQSQEITALDVEASENALTDARRAVVNGRLARRLAEVRAWFAAGSLKGAILKEVSQ